MTDDELEKEEIRMLGKLVYLVENYKLEQKLLLEIQAFVKGEKERLLELRKEIRG